MKLVEGCTEYCIVTGKQIDRVWEFESNYFALNNNLDLDAFESFIKESQSNNTYVTILYRFENKSLNQSVIEWKTASGVSVSYREVNYFEEEM
mgnify:CR=1 FL=1